MNQLERRLLFDLLEKFSKDMSFGDTGRFLAQQLRKEVALGIVQGAQRGEG